MRIGVVCPYSFDVPGGVQGHVRDLAEHLIARGHDVSVLAPADEETPVPPYVAPAGRAVAVPYNGSVARLTFGPVTALRVRRWLAEGGFDVLHLHEPITPSAALLALWAAEGPLVATFHTSQLRSRALQAASPLVLPSLEKVSARIAVSEDARRTLVEHLGGDAVVIPNGVDVDAFARARPRPSWQGTPAAPTLAFLGRLEEPRKGFAVLAAALPALRAARPGLRLLVAGRGDPEQARALAGEHADALELLGPVSDADKAALLSSVDAYVAPQTAGESFGIVLLEAMSAGTAVVASALPSFGRVLDGGRLGALAPVGDPRGLARAVLELLDDVPRRRALVAAASAAVRRYDWSRVAEEVLAVYETVAGTGAGTGTGAGAAAPAARAGARAGVREDPLAHRLLSRWLGP
ncbi:glycosyltransferase family 4 protein [Quadrisphaera sp. DSM 44207]|uniref:glycosyltransferase family 4 protein n=1 Tax=Quadrisphaera sp. DSM 44207 TaxID=1881057 RepID=UPI0008807CB9|nr:glycosyltransferase family 4 protein [Quadrisphaera sp. DSM 44207]SDQ48385.1 Phosphatidylinositol alpha-mannosyltransferase [Quadrisphaera sp. DSM 44207]